MVVSPAAANSHFTYCELDGEESVIDSVNDNGDDISDDFPKENKSVWTLRY